MIVTDTTCLTIFTVTHVMLPPHNILPSHIFDLMIDIEKQSLLGKINVISAAYKLLVDRSEHVRII